ncbi:hypothetical protein CSE45_2831 [Citreicella sp. SE45]|nr:hypothetical protein CSE45_2831 [Citreicella sp. SE45]
MRTGFIQRIIPQDIGTGCRTAQCFQETIGIFSNLNRFHTGEGA